MDGRLAAAAVCIRVGAVSVVLRANGAKRISSG